MVPHQLRGKCGLPFMVSRDECKFETICLKIKNLHYLAEKKHMDVRTYISKTSGRGIKTGKKNHVDI